MLFQSRGMPMAELAAAERACAGQTYVSDRELCMREWVARHTAIGSPNGHVLTYLAWPPRNTLFRGTHQGKRPAP
jgi:hypothetical protein